MAGESNFLDYKNILIVTENYTFGGLETHLLGKIKHLSNCGHNLFLITGTSFLEKNLPYEFCKKIYTGFNISGSVTSQEAVEASYRIAEVIWENKINVVDAHPFYSSLPAFFAAFLTTTPFIYTLHGPASVMEEFGTFKEWFTKCVLFENASLVSNVSKETYALTKNYVPSSRNVIYNNAVDVDVFIPGNHEEDKFEKCCVVSRLDSAKVAGIKEFITLASYTTSITEIDIYGDGPEYYHLSEWISSEINKDNLSVQLKGVCFDLCRTYREYSIVAGMGRVALEAAALNKPVILVGYDGVKGILDKDLIEHASFNNLSGRGLKSIDRDTFIQQLESLVLDDSPYRLSQWIGNNANEKRNWSDFSKQIESINCHFSDMVHDVFQCFSNHTSDVPYASDEVMLDKIRNVLRSTRHIKSNAYAFLWDLDQRVHNKLLVTYLKQAEDYKLYCSDKDEIIRINQRDIQALTEQLLNKEKRLQALLQAAMEAEQRISEQSMRVEAMESELALKAQAVLETEQRLLEKDLIIASLESELALSVQAATDAIQSLSDREQRVETLELQIVESEQRNHDVTLAKKSLQYKLKTLELDLDWYKATFEDRSLFGIIKDKAFKAVPK